MTRPAAPSLDDLVRRGAVDPGDGLQVVDVARLPAVPFDPRLSLVVLPSAAAPAPPLPGRHARRDPVAVLRSLYPPSHGVTDLESGTTLELASVDAERLRRGTWLIRPVEPIDNIASPHGLPWISARLRAPDGCPWDRRQDHASLRRYLLEEAYETLDAIEHGSPADLAEELGDLLLQVILHAQLAAEAGEFDLTDVYRSIGAKIVRRHPHVFGETRVTGVEQVMRNWEAIKSDERAARAGDDEDGGRNGGFDRLLRALPALPASRELQERVASAGWDWPSVEGVWDKVAEELGELRAAIEAHDRVHEVGDVLFALVNLARWLDVDPEDALRQANRRWVERYQTAERLAAERGVELAALDAEAKDRLWDEAKRVEPARGG